MADTALKTFSLENDIVDVSPDDAIYKFDADANRQIQRDAPWEKE